MLKLIWKVSKVALAIVLIIMLISIVAFCSDKKTTTSQSVNYSNKSAVLKQDTTGITLELKKFIAPYSTMEADFEITNNKDYDIKDLSVSCDILGKSGTVIHTLNKTIFQNFPKNKKVTVPKINMGFINSQAASAQCYCTGYEPDGVVPMTEPKK